MERGDEVAIHFSGDSITQWQRALNNVSNLYGDESVPTPADGINVVVNGPGVRFLLRSSPEAERVGRLAEAGVNVAACGNSLSRFDHEEGNLVPGVEVVPAGVAELVRLQRGACSYLKLP
jgi:intracellular sulfur oxidation DsrE/DsrF family protein